MLNLISKKQEGASPKNRRSRESTAQAFGGSRRGGNIVTPERKHSGITLQGDILEQLNAVNSVLAPHLINGYH